jgi:hypothetical protein
MVLVLAASTSVTFITAGRARADDGDEVVVRNQHHTVKKSGYMDSTRSGTSRSTA